MLRAGINLVITLAVVLAVGTFPAQSQEKPKDGLKRDYDALAEKLVTLCARVQEGDLVTISGRMHDVEMLENLAVHVAKVGGDPLITQSGSDKMNRRMYTDVAAKYDSRTPPFARKLADLVNVQFEVESPETDALANIPAERIAARAKAYLPTLERALKRNIRQVSLGNGMYPTEERAKQFGISKDELAKLFWDGLNVDYGTLQKTGEKVKNMIASGKEMQITHPNGTNLTMRVAGRPVFVSDGVITAEKQKRGGAACQVWLPAGDIFLAPVPGTAEGRVVIDRLFFENKEVQGLELIFRAGKLTKMQAKAGGERLQAQYDAAGSGKDEFGFINLGINPNLRLPAGSKILAWSPEGMINIGTGNNLWAEGENAGGNGTGGPLPGCTLKVDGKVLVEKGVLVP